MVNKHCCQIFGDRFEQMLTKSSQSEVSAFHVLGTETSFGWNLKLGRTEIGMVNNYCGQNFGEPLEEMLTKPSQSEVSVLYALGTETSFGSVQQFGRMIMEGSTFIVAKILDNDVKKC